MCVPGSVESALNSHLSILMSELSHAKTEENEISIMVNSKYAYIE